MPMCVECVGARRCMDACVSVRVSDPATVASLPYQLPWIYCSPVSKPDSSEELLVVVL